VDKKDLHLVREIRKRVRSRNRPCLIKDCTQPAIMSHLLQQNGILDHIAQKAHIIQLNSDIFFDETNFRFQKRSIGKAEVLTYKGFCSKCDNRVFESIEKISPDYHNYKTQILFSYRAFLSEYSRILYGLDAYTEYVACRELSPQIKARFAPMKRRAEIQLSCFEYYLKLFENELTEKSNKSFLSLFPPRRHFKFHTIVIPKIEVAASATFSYAEDVPMTREEYNLIKPLNEKTAAYIKPIFINIIPRENNTVIIVGYGKGATRIELMAANKIDKLSTKEIYKLLSDILIKRIDHWCISVPFFEKMKKTGNDKKVINLKHEYFTHPLSSLQLIVEMDLDFNLFSEM
jgi:hypothetical protein